MSKGLYHCSRCKQHFYDHEATAMHIKDKHGGKGKVLHHPTEKELLIREQQHLARIEELHARAEAAEAKRDAAVAAAYEDAAGLVPVDLNLISRYEAQDRLLDARLKIRMRAGRKATAALERVRREARNEGLEAVLQLIPDYHDDEWIWNLRAPHFKRVLAVVDRRIRAMMEEQDDG